MRAHLHHMAWTHVSVLSVLKNVNETRLETHFKTKHKEKMLKRIEKTQTRETHVFPKIRTFFSQKTRLCKIVKNPRFLGKKKNSRKKEEK